MKFLLNMLSSGSKISSKRVITALSFLLLAIAFVANLFFDFTIEDNVYNGMYYITLGGLGFTASEKFTTNKGEKNKEEEIN
jgi:hypothetical protein